MRLLFLSAILLGCAACGVESLGRPDAAVPDSGGRTPDATSSLDAGEAQPDATPPAEDAGPAADAAVSGTDASEPAPDASAPDAGPSPFALRLSAGLDNGTATYGGLDFVPMAPYVTSAAGDWDLCDQANSYCGGSALAIANTDYDELYRGQIWSCGASLDLSIALPNGTYQVYLHDAETTPSVEVVGGRVASVKAEGQVVLADWDIFVDAGNAANTAVRQSFAVTVNDGALDLSFVAQVSCPKICAIEILSPGGSPLPLSGSSPVSVAITPVSATVPVGGSLVFLATVTGTSNHSVTWTIAEASNCGTVAGGTYTAPNVIGTCHVKATSDADATKSATATVTVVQPGTNPVIVWAETFDTLTTSDEMGGTNRSIGWNSTYTNDITAVAGRGKVLQVNWEQGSLGPNAGFGNYRIYLDHLYRELYLSWDYFVQAGFDWGDADGLWGGKFFGGLSGGTQVAIPYDASYSPDLGWATMNMFQVAWFNDYRYLHNTDMDCTDLICDYNSSGWPWAHFQHGLDIGSWHNITVRVKVNDVGQANGIFEYFYDQVLVAQAQEADRIYVNPSHPGYWIDAIFLNNFWGGNGAGYESPKAQFFRFDNLMTYYFPTGSAGYRAGLSEAGRTLTPPAIVDTRPPSPNRFEATTYTEASGTIKSHCAFATPVDHTSGVETAQISVAGATALTLTVTDFTPSMDPHYGMYCSGWDPNRQILNIYEGTGASKTLKKQFICTGDMTVPATFSIAGSTATIEWQAGRTINPAGFSLDYTSNGAGSGTNFRCAGDLYGPEWRAVQ